MRLVILGGGQLARMLALSSHPLGIDVLVLTEEADCPAAQVAEVVVTDFKDFNKILSSLKSTDYVTFEFENIPLNLVKEIASYNKVYPSENSLYITQHRVREKKFAERLGIPVPKYIHVENASSLETALSELSFQAILKTCSSGYDGKGQWRISDKSDLLKYSSQIPDDIVAESFVRFDREVSIIIVKSFDGEIRSYDICQNVHESGTLRKTVNIPKNSSQEEDKILNLGVDYASRIANALDYVGVLAVEFFQIGSELFFNEYAPRVHNSGHWTIEGTVTSQFENHVRACMCLPLGDTTSYGFSAMRNLLGETNDKTEILKTPGAHYHWYGKSEVRDRRKVGHVTINSDSKIQTEKLYQNLFGDS